MNSNPASVLVIEDQPVMRAVLCDAIEAEPDLQVSKTVPNGMIAIQVSSQHDLLFLASKPDIILLALGNPGLKDLEGLKVLCDTLPDTPILAFTCNEVPGQEQAALQSGAHAVLTKAASRAELISKLHELRNKTFMSKKSGTVESNTNLISEKEKRK
jgi:two-component system nitrate/nitrite response regulator NarL